MRTDEPKTIRLEDYEPPAYQTRSTHLTFELEEGGTLVTNVMQVERQPHARQNVLELDGEHLELVSLELDGEPVAAESQMKTPTGLQVADVGERAEVKIVTRIYPETNTALEGLYISSGMYCTQCEAQGFRRITYFQDRPDVSARYKTTIIADAARYPVLLSNGNLVAEETLDDGRRSVTWEDPHPKPSYLFALVAGDLAVLNDTFTTQSGREVRLQIFSEPHNISQCDYAMAALKRSMRWDEEVFGREYDLDIFMVVAVDDFNMGAMENKGLNIFNTSCVLASPDTATDARYQRVESVVAHEYFHNWSGNRVTCRDWFQLSLKEGFTVFRDAEFSADMNARSVKRIEDVQDLRDQQFPEDAGPLAHAVRPNSYVEISNFYTRTVYEKGAEVVRMLQTILGPQAFRQGSDLYFERHDGSAATTEDFVRAMADASGADLVQFERWYSQAGTPELTVSQSFEGSTLTLTIRQQCSPTPGQSKKEPFHIPITIGLVGAVGDLLSDALSVESTALTERRGPSLLLHLREASASLSISGLEEQPAVSFLRGFSAPVKVSFARDAAQLDQLIRHDSDGFCRWDAARTRSLEQMERMRVGASVTEGYLATWGELADQALVVDDPESALLLGQILTLPSEADFFAQIESVDVDQACDARLALYRALGEAHLSRWQALYERNAPQPGYEPNLGGIARRTMSRVALRYLSLAEDVAALSSRLERHFREADNLSDRLMAFEFILDSPKIDEALRERVDSDFLSRWREHALVVDEWFSAQARSPSTDIAKIESLEVHDAFMPKNPNKIRSLYREFATKNHRRFHAADGSGYALIAERVRRIDAFNPQSAARLARSFANFRQFDAKRQTLARTQLEELARGKLSKDVYEVVHKSLRDA